MKTKQIITVVIALFIAFVGYKLYSNKKEINDQSNQKEAVFKMPVQVAKVQTKSLTTALTATGEFEGFEEVFLVAESQGSITSLFFKEGDIIKKGQIFAKIDASSLSAQLTSAKFNYAKAQKDVERYQRLEKAGAVSKTQLESMKIQLESTRSSIAQINQQLGFSTVKATISGVVNEIMVEPTSFVQAGNNMAEIVQIDKLKIIINVSEVDLVNIKNNQKVIIKTDVYPLVDFEGTVSNISVKADEAGKFKITIVTTNSKKEQLRAGMFGEVHFETLKNNTQEALTIPREAIVNSLQDPKVYVVENNKAVLKSIKIGKVISNDVIVLEGLSVNELVIYQGIINLKNNTLVKITNSK
ncbi:efflux RND transporter periplasmic adaptor subunit [Flavobacterium frigoris]|uniref:Co/Zn/Cd efflux system membrane fusion protein n=1 Tax=Flavobacterium frigoris (strain PS1) TaxID=1086011 RepID=H7FTP4_FLAFP|nr:efflux RND transporter periplasmic adaptor subunit [Flavobacterium frigoris]EIA08523.1 putative Co/Zn/Cd efflux system membrane fusion protein [Flavobacterium frigoris PS1]